MVPILLLKQKWWDEEVFVFFKISVWVIYVLIAFWHFLSNKQSVSPSTVFVIVKQCCKVCACVSEHVCAVSHACLTCQCLWAQLQSTVIISVVNLNVLSSLCSEGSAAHKHTTQREIQKAARGGQKFMPRPWLLTVQQWAPFYTTHDSAGKLARKTEIRYWAKTRTSLFCKEGRSDIFGIYLTGFSAYAVRLGNR